MTRMTRTFVELTGNLVTGFDIVDFLQTITEHCVELLDVDAAGILLADEQGTLHLVAGSIEQEFAVEHAAPMRLRGQTFGVLVLFRGSPGVIPAVAQSFADVATIGILNVPTDDHAARLHTALNGRILIEQAKGVVAERLQVSMADAFALLRTYARKHSTLLSEVARAVISKAVTVTDLTI